MYSKERGLPAERWQDLVALSWGVFAAAAAQVQEPSHTRLGQGPLWPTEPHCPLELESLVTALWYDFQAMTVSMPLGNVRNYVGL